MKKRRVPKTAFKKGHPKLGGRKKGTPNKITTDLKQAIVNALDRAGGKGGGEDYFLRSARRQPRAFLGLVGKCIPTQVTGKDGGPIELLLQKAQSGLANLSDAELKALQALLSKAGVSE